jgi:hypothetical protein
MFSWKFNKILVISRLLTFLFIIFCVGEFLKVGISKHSKEDEEQTMTFFSFSFSCQTKKKTQPFCLLRHTFSFS